MRQYALKQVSPVKIPKWTPIAYKRVSPSGGPGPWCQLDDAIMSIEMAQLALDDGSILMSQRKVSDGYTELVIKSAKPKPEDRW